MKHFGELLDYVSISAGMALAASCYMVLGQLHRTALGMWAPVAIACAGLFCLLVAGSLSQLAARFPSSPGIRTYLNAAFGNRLSFFLVCIYLSMVVLVGGVEACIIKFLLTPMLGPSLAAIVVLAMFALVITVNLCGLEAPRVFQIVATVSLIVFGAGLGLAALSGTASVAAATVTVTATAALPDMTLDTLPTFLSAVAMSIFLFIGFEWVTPLGRSPQAYRRRIPGAMVIAIIVLTGMYAALSAGLEHLYHGRTFPADRPPHLSLGSDLFGAAGYYLAVSLSMLAMLTSFNAGMMGAARLVYGMARERILPKQLASINLDTGAPVGAIILIASLAVCGAGMMLVDGMSTAAAIVAATIASVIYGFLVLASIVVERKDRQERGGGQACSGFLPLPLQCLCGVLMPLLGIAAFFSGPVLRDTALILAGVGVACLGILYAVRRNF